jgi:uncharacterized protein (UPF0332 family)
VPIDWTDVLGLAVGLSANADEASLRSAISRAYYAAFNLARLWLVAKGVNVPKTGAAHAVVWDRLDQHGLASEAVLGRALRDMRNNADYDDVLPFDPGAQAQVALSHARTLIAGLV